MKKNYIRLREGITYWTAMISSSFIQTIRLYRNFMNASRVFKPLGKAALVWLLFFTSICAFGQTALGHATVENNGTGNGTRQPNYIEAWDRFVVPAGTKYTISAFVIYQSNSNGQGKMRFGLYNESGTNNLGSLVAGSDTGDLTIKKAQGWVRYEVAPFTLSPGTYWIANQFDSLNSKFTLRSTTGSADHLYVTPFAYQAMPSVNFPSGIQTDGTKGLMSMYFVGCPTYTLTAPPIATSVCGSGISTITLASTSVPNGNYTVTYDTNNPATTGNTTTLTFSGGKGTFSTKSLSATSTITVTSISSGTTPLICSTSISSNNTVNVTVNQTAAPGGAAVQSFCSETSPTVAKLQATGSTIKWYAAATGGTPLTTTTSLVNGAHYFASQTANGCESTSRLDVTASVSTLPEAPAAQAGSGSTCTQISANWSSSANATGYYLDVSTVSTFASFVNGFNNLDVGNATTKNITGLSGGTTYYYRVKAYNKCGSSTDSPTISLATSSVATPGIAVGYSPTCSGFTAQWGYATNATTYYIDVATDSGFTKILSTYDNSSVGNALEKTITGLLPGTTYYYRVRAAGCGTSANSQTMNMTTLSVAIPGTAQATNPTCTSFTARWGSSANATAYFIDVATDSGFTKILSTYDNSSVGNALEKTITGLLPGTTYYYRVRAAGCGTSANSATMSLSTTSVAVPGTAEATNATCTGFIARWGYASNATTYDIDVATDSGFANILADYNNLGVGNVLEKTITGLLPGTTYYYRVRAAGCGTSANSQTMSLATSSVTVPGTAEATNATCTGFTARWGYASNATTYYIDVATDSGFANIVADYNNLGVGNALEKTITGLVPGTTYYYRVRAAGCGTSANSPIMNYTTSRAPTVPPVAGAASPNGDCSAIVLNWSAAANATGYYLDISTDSSFKSFVSGYNNYNIAYNGASFDAGGLPAGVLYYRLRAYNSCGVTGNSNVISFSTATSSNPIVSSITQPDCNAAGTVVLSGLPTAGTIKQTGTVTADYPITGTTMTVSGLAAGSYKFAVLNINGYCLSAETGTIVITAPVTNTWNGSSWSAGAAPTAAQTIKFTQSFTSTGNLSACACIIESGNVTIKSGHTLALANQLEVNADASFTLEDKAILLQENKDAVNTGKINVERKVTGLRNEPGKAVDYVYWSSPVEGQQTKGPGGFSPGTPNANFFFYNEANDRFYETGDLTFTPGRGYAVRAETIIDPATGLPFTQYNKTYKFTGKVNNGTIERNIIRSPDNPAGVVHGYNLVGNPYPSNIDFNELYLANCEGSDCLIYNTAWFWTNNMYTANQMGSGYSGNNYAIFNGTGGVPATSPYNGGLTPNGNIGVGQAFIVQKIKPGTKPLQFKNSNGAGRNIRVSSPATFFQKENGDKNKFWLKLISPTQLVNSQLIGYVAGATDGYEQDFDAEAFGDFSDLFYSVLGTQKMVIQGRSEDFSADDQVDLGAIFFQNGVYTIEVGETEGIFAGGQKIYLKDKQSNIITDLSQGSYSFVATKGNNATRFEIIYKPETVLATESSVKEAVVVYRRGNDFVVKSSKKKITGIELYDTTGRLIYKKSPNGLTVVIPAEELVNTVYILKIDRSGEITTKKILR